MQHRGLHARSVHANPISRHCWVMVRRGFCLCYRDDMKIETCFPPALQAWMVFWHRIFCSGAVGPVMARPHHPCRLSCSRVWDKPSLRPRPRPPQNPHDARCWLFIVGCPVACFLSHFLVDSQHQHPKTTCATAPTAQRNIPTIGIIALHSFKRFLYLPTGFPRGRRRVIADHIHC